jgi:hypothetical protein
MPAYGLLFLDGRGRIPLCRTGRRVTGSVVNDSSRGTDGATADPSSSGVSPGRAFTLPVPTLTAVILPGAITNRVRVLGPKGGGLAKSDTPRAKDPTRKPGRRGAAWVKRSAR